MLFTFPQCFSVFDCYRGAKKALIWIKGLIENKYPISNNVFNCHVSQIVINRLCHTSWSCFLVLNRCKCSYMVIWCGILTTQLCGHPFLTSLPPESHNWLFSHVQIVQSQIRRLLLHIFFQPMCKQFRKCMDYFIVSVF